MPWHLKTSLARLHRVCDASNIAGKVLRLSSLRDEDVLVLVTGGAGARGSDLVDAVRRRRVLRHREQDRVGVQGRRRRQVPRLHRRQGAAQEQVSPASGRRPLTLAV